MSQADDSNGGAATIELPEKTYFKIGEVAKFLEVEPYVLRYWETEFDVLEPEKTKSGQRVYQRDDIELLFQIRTLLYEEMFTIAGACRQLERSREGKPSYFDLESNGGHAAGTAVAGDEELHRQLESARRELTGTQTELGELKDKYQTAADELRQSREELEQKHREVEALQQEVANLEKRSRRLSDENEQLGEDIADARQALEERSKAANSEKVESLKKRVTQLKAKLEDAQKKARQSRRRRERAAQKRREERRQVLNSLRREVETVASLAKSKNSGRRGS